MVLKKINYLDLGEQNKTEQKQNKSSKQKQIQMNTEKMTFSLNT